MRKELLTLLCALGLVACQQQDTSDATNNTNTLSSEATDAPVVATAPQTDTAEPHENIVARIQGMPVQQNMIDEQIKLKLYDLEWAKYELRRASLAQLVDQALQSGRVAGQQIEVLLEPPMPPRLDVNPAGQPAIGQAEAPVTLSVFCSYQSSHCGRMQATYQALREHYGEQVRFVFYDYPQAFHRQGPEAAFAARCAHAAGQFEAFHKALWAQQNQLGADLYKRLAKQLAFDEKAFEQCLDQRLYLDEVKANMTLAEGFGFVNVPVTLVNGLYLNGPKTADTLRFFIDQELARLGKTVPSDHATQQSAQALPVSELPLALEGVVLSDNPDASKAMIRHLEAQNLKAYQQDESVLDKVFVVLIESERVILENDGRLEYLPLKTNAKSVAEASDASTSEDATAMSENETAGQTEADIPEEIRMAAESQGFKARPIVAAQGETPLSRAWLEQQLQNKGSLQEHFKPAALEVEGVHVLKLRNVAENEFYQTLGLMEGDVVLRVNDEWVHEDQNNLFAYLENEQSVSVVLMRRGLPVHLKYAIN